jgi:hypothetical protein
LVQGQKGFLFIFGTLLYLFWRHAISYGLNMANSTLFWSKYGNFGHFFPTKAFVGFSLLFFVGHQVAKFHPQKKEGK